MAVVLPIMASSVHRPSSPILAVHPAHHPSLRGRAWTTGTTDHHRRLSMAAAAPSSHTSPDDVDEMDEDDMEEEDEFEHNPLQMRNNEHSGVHRTRRPRRRADEVERLYKCTWNGCEKSYGTLSHLNDHVRLQRHGDKREPHEFKEARRIWRQERKSRRLRDHAMHAAQQQVTQRNPVHHHLAPPTTTVYPLHALYAPSVAPESPYREQQRQLQQDQQQTERDEDYSDDRVPLAVASAPRSGALFLLPGLRPTIMANSPSSSVSNSTVDVRLPSIAELRLDLSLDEYEAQTALSNAAGHHRSPYQRTKAPPPYFQQHQSDQSLSPEYSRFRLSATTGPSSPSASSVDFSYTQPPSFVYPAAARSRASSHSHPTNTRVVRPSHSNNPSRPSTSTSSSTNSTNGAYRLSTPMSYIPPSSSASSSSQYPSQTFPFIPAPPPRGVNDASSDGTPTSTTTAGGLTAGMEPRRKRRKYEEIERRYLCGWNGCAKAYGTLNHLNDHVSLQNHGPKRRSNEF